MFRREKQAVRLGFVATLTRLRWLTIEVAERAVSQPVQDRCITLENRRYEVRKRSESIGFSLIHRIETLCLTRHRFALFLKGQPLVLGGGELGAGLVEVGHQPVETRLVPGVEPRVVEALF